MLGETTSQSSLTRAAQTTCGNAAPELPVESLVERTIQACLFVLLVGLFLVSVFKNIQYPLLWNDESETAMYAKRILQFGYPKIHDGRNVVWLSELADKEIGINRRIDACTAIVWGQYYFASIGAFLAEKVDDIYLKTAFLRIPFALIGCLGLFIMASAVVPLLERRDWMMFFILFITASLLSVSLMLHLREVRHPSMVVFLTGCIFYVYNRRRFYENLGALPYGIALFLLLIAVYNVLFPVYPVFIAAIGIYETRALFVTRKVRDFLIAVAPLAASLAFAIPFFFLSGSYALGRAYSSIYSHSSSVDLLSSILNFFCEFEFLYLVIFAKVVAFGLGLYFHEKRLDKGRGPLQQLRVSNFLSLFFIVYALSMSAFPSDTLFERYFIVLQPVTSLIFLLDVFASLGLISKIPSPTAKQWGKRMLVTSLFAGFLLNGSNKIEPLQSHAYELFHQYRGPLDYAIPFIMAKYSNPRELVMATNYEELAYMYYLGSRVVIGFVNNNLEEDMRTHPDILHFRKSRPSPVSEDAFNHFLSQDRYERVDFPVSDYLVNNIPERNCRWVHHLFETPYCEDATRCLTLYLKKQSAGYQE